MYNVPGMARVKTNEPFNIGLALSLVLAFSFLHFVFLISIPDLGSKVVSEIHWSQSVIWPAFFVANRWADLGVGLIYAFLIAFILTSKYMSRYHAPVGFTTGLIVGAVASAIITLIVRIFALPYWAFLISLFGGALVALVSILITFAAYDFGRGLFFVPTIIMSAAAGTVFGNGFIFGLADGLVLALPFAAAGIVLGLISWSFFLFACHKISPDKYPTGPLY